MRNPNSLALALAAALLAVSAAGAQSPAVTASVAVPAPSAAAAAPATTLPAGDVYRREVFRYQRGGRPDPFAPLLTAAELGFRVEDLRLTAIIYSPDARRSVAVFAERDSARRYRMHQGQRLGTMTVTRIWPQRVDVRVDEFGGSRLQTILLQRAARQEAVQDGGVDPNAGAPPAAQQAPAEPRVLRRGVRPPAATAAPAQAAPAPQRSVNPRSPSYTTSPRP
jgi:hypothetical protein